MGTRLLKSLIVPVFAVICVVWVFARPLASLGLFFYHISGAYLSSIFQNIQQTQKEASDLLVAQEKLKEMEEEVKRLSLENIKFKARAGKLEILEEKLSFQNSASMMDLIPARVVGRSPDYWHKQIIIAKGKKDGIKVGRGVLTEKGIVGQICKVGHNNSVVQLIFDRDWRMGVKIPRLNQYGVLSGNYPGPAYLEFIPVDSEVKAGDEILTSGICLDVDNCPYPENFPVGTVVQVEKDPNVVDLSVRVKFHEDLTGLREVFVLK